MKLLSTNTNYITLEGHGRENSISKNNIDIYNTLGWFTTMYPVELSTKDNIGDSIKHIKETLRQIPNNGIGYNAIEGYSKLPLIVFNYLGQLNQARKEDEWAITGEDSGITISTKNKDRNIININGVVVDSKLSFNVSSKLENSLHDKLVKLFNKQLENVIKHCYENKYKCEYTISDFKAIESEGDLANFPMLVNNNNWFEITEIQKSYLLGRLANYEIGNVSNHIYMEYYYKKLDITKLERVLQKIIREIPILRSVFSYETLMQKFLPEVDEYKIKIHQYTTKFNLNNIEQVRKRLSHKVYNPEEYPLFTFEVSKFSDYIVLHVSIDMVLLDAQSRELFFNFINKYYKNELQQIDISEVTFKDYQNYITLLKNSLWYKRDKAYWADKLASIPLRPELHFVKNPSSIKTPTFKEHTIFIEKRDWLAFKKQVEKHNLSYSSVLLSLYGSVISYYSGSSRLPITMTVFNRYGIHDKVNEILGDFTSTNLFTYENDNASFTQNLKRTHEEMWENISHILYTGVEVQRDLAKLHKLDMSQAVSPIVFTGIIGNQSKATYSKYLEDNELLEKRYISAQTSQAWIDLQVIEVDDKFMSMWLHVEEIFEEGYIAKLNNLYCDLIKHLAHNDWDSSTEIFTPVKEEQNIIAAANSAEQSITEDTLFSRYENIVKTKNLYKQTVVVDSQGEYLHEQLLSDSDKLAKYLYKKSQQPLIGILSEKSYNQVVSTLSIMQSGYGYLPLNVDWPVKRIGEILDEAKVDILLISAREYVQKAKELDKYNLIIIEDKLKEIAGISIKLSPIQADDVAYVIFTSGSTGKPKGVTITHRGALNTIDAVNNRFNISEKDRVLALSELSFDLSVYDIFGMLNVGGQIVFPDQDKTKEPKHWLELIDKHKITIWNTVPQLADLLVNETKEAMNSLRLFLLSGDWISPNLPDNIKQSCPQACVMSLGGATEGSIWSIWYEVKEVKKDWNIIPYGVAMPNQKMYVLNKNLRDSPIGAVGIIYIGGMGVALNYWDNEELTKNSFITHKKYGRLYYTGDLGRWNKDGYIEFIGRKDLQVKLNGYRVELEEIAAKINNIKGIDKAVVNLQNNKDHDYLIGYIVPEQKINKKEINSEEFKLKQSGLLNDIKVSYNLHSKLDEQDYRLRKSYRKFSAGKINLDLITKTYNKLKENICAGSIDTNKLELEHLESLLGVISGIQLEDRALPKYRYPSGGSTYSVRCFVNIGEQIGDMQTGYYYYHPIKQTLCLISSSKSEETEIYLIANWEAIKPLYGDASEKLALQEAGHMLSLLLTELDKQGFGYKLDTKRQDLDDNNSLLGKLIIGGNKQEIPAIDLSLNYLTKDGNIYKSTDSTRECIIKTQDIFAKTQELTQLLSNGSYLLVQEGIRENDQVILSGLLFQRLGEELYKANIGSCMIGLKPYEGTLYTMVIGSIEEEDKELAESRIITQSIAEAINNELKDILPEYMIPYDYSILESLPLTASGKIDTKQLPHLEFVGDTYIAPTTKLEKQLCDIWQELLNAENVGIVDNFFKLGGDSISAIKLVSKIKNLDYTVTVKDIFENASIDKLCIKLVKTETENELEIDHNFITVVNYPELIEKLEKAYGKIEGIYPANSLQQGFISHFLTYPDDDAYIVQILFDYNVDLDVEKYKQAWVKITETYPILRTCFNWEKELIQVVYKKSNLDCNYLDLTDVKDKANKITKIQQKYRKEGFDLSKSNLFSLAIIKQSESHFTVLFNHHHAIMDGFSIPILMEKVIEYYKQLIHNEQLAIIPDRTYLDAQYYYYLNKKRVEEYWNKEIRLIENVSDLSALLSKKVNIKGVKTLTNLEKVFFELSGDDYRDLSKLSKNLEITLNMLIQFAWHKLCQVYTNATQTIVGTTVSGRDIPVKGIMNSIGLFINTLPLILNWDDKVTVRKQLSSIKKKIIEFNSHSFVNLAKLQKEGERLFDSLFVFENQSMIREMKEVDLYPNAVKDIQKTDYPFNLVVYEFDTSLKVKLEFDEKLLSVKRAKSYMSQLELIIKGIKANLDKSHNSLTLLTKSEYELVVYDWNNTDKEYPDDKTIHALFEEQVVKSPNNIAVKYEDVKLIYKELNERANQLAQYLIKHHNIKPDSLITLLLDRSECMIISILGVLKAGAAYVPINPEYPEDRIKYILNDTKTDIVITNEIYNKKVNKINKKVSIIAIDCNIQKLYKYLTTNPIIDNLTSNNLSYIIYTSGTTGKPKGVQIEHHSVVNLLLHLNKNIYNKHKQNISAFTSYTFDVSVSEFFCALISGNSLNILSNTTKKDALLISKYINEHSINYLYLPPVVLSELPRVKYKTLDKIVYAGEPCDRNTALYWSTSYKLYNYYGLTEGTVHFTEKKIINGNVASIGSPISNSKAYVLSSELLPLPIGAIGELYVSGVGLARGYLNKPDLTKEKFIPNPFQSDKERQTNKNSRLYKTGDLVRWLTSGELEYIGRNDFQVKIRGFRIELGEIESTLNEYKGVKQAVVLARENKKTTNKYLVAYYTSSGGDKLNEEEVFSYLATKLPEYMIPIAIIHLDKLPLTLNGKLDRKALPDPVLSNVDRYVAPRNKLESKLCHIFSDVLGIEADNVGINDDFFRLGGNSINAIKLANKINNNTSFNISIADIFKYKNIKNLAYEIEKHNKASITIPKVNVKQEKQVLSFAQERLFFIDKYEQGTNAYNIPIAYKLNENTNINFLIKAIHSIVKRQHILRSSIKEDNGNLYQYINSFSDKYFNKVIVKNSQELNKSMNKDINYIFDLSNEYPIKVVIYSLEDSKEQYISVVIHHIAFDGWSIDILINELRAFYDYYNNNIPVSLAKLDIQYKDFAIWQRKYLSGKLLAKQTKYWKQLLDGYENIALSSDYARPLQIDYIGNSINFELGKKLSHNLRNIAKQLGVSLYTLLLASYYLMLRAYSNQDDIVVGAPMANRHYPKIQDLMGFFINSLPIRIKINDKHNLVEFIKKLGKQVMETQLHQDLPFEKLVDELNVEKDTSQHPIFQIMFGVQSFGSRKIDKENILLPYNEKDIKYNITKFDIETFIDDSDEILRGSFNYRVSLYKKSTIKRFIDTYTHILKQVAQITNSMSLHNITYINKQEEETILRKWNNTDKVYPSNKTIHALFEEQVVKSPNNIAVIYEDVKLTYKELNERANQLAHYLIKHHNIKPDSLITLLLDRSECMIISILGVLKAGAAYVPMDPEYPDDRIKYILNDTKTDIVITNEIYNKKVNKINKKVSTIGYRW